MRKLAVALSLGLPITAQNVGGATPEQSLPPFFEKWCSQCHAGDESETDLDLAALLSSNPWETDLELALELREQIRTSMMPPEDEPQPSSQERREAVAWTDKFLRLAVTARPRDPGRVTVRRLSRTEYTNTIRDLLGIETNVADSFPADDLGYGFDSIGDVMSVSTTHLEKYLEAAREISEQTIPNEDTAQPPQRHFKAVSMKSSLRNSRQGSAAVLYTSGTLSQKIELPREGDYLIRVRAYASRGGKELARMRVRIGAKTLDEIEVAATRGHPKIYELRARLLGGNRSVSVSFLNDYYQPKHPDPKLRDRNLYLDWIEVVGPLDRLEPTFGHRWIFAADDPRKHPVERARSIVTTMIGRAWRRPAKTVEVDRLANLVKAAVQDGSSFERALQLALQAVLVSPNFLFRLEPEADDAEVGTHDLDGWAMASRLSYFLWSSMPDQTLFDLASSKQLTRPTVLQQQVSRMLADERSSSLAKNFSAQWLELRRLNEVMPDPELFPRFTQSTRRDMRLETEMFFLSVMREKRNVFDLLDADFSFLNENLADFYDIEGIEGAEMRRVRFDDGRRGGVVSHASFLTVTSNPTRTSPVKRGKWILENLLDDPPPPPPPNVPALAETPELSNPASLREAMAQHSTNKVCASCHSRMDAIGFALENYDAVGRWRDGDAKGPIDASGKLPDGRKIDGPAGLKKLLQHDRGFLRCLTKKLFTFAIGRDPSPLDSVHIDDLVESLEARPTIEDLIKGIVKLEAFRQRMVGG